MPYASVDDVPKSVPEDKRSQWRAVWNSTHAAALKDGMSNEKAEAKAFAIANGVTNKVMIPSSLALKLGEMDVNVAAFKKRTIQLENDVKKGGPGSGRYPAGSGEHPQEIQHKGETYFHTGKVGVNRSTGNASAEYKHQGKDESKFVWRDSGTGKVADDYNGWKTDAKKGGPGSGRYPAGSGKDPQKSAAAASRLADNAGAKANREGSITSHKAAAEAHRIAAVVQRTAGNESAAKEHEGWAKTHDKQARSAQRFRRSLGFE